MLSCWITLMFRLIWTPIWCEFVQLDALAEAVVVYVCPCEGVQHCLNVLVSRCLYNTCISLAVNLCNLCNCDPLKNAKSFLLLKWQTRYVLLLLLERFLNLTVFPKWKMTPSHVCGLASLLFGDISSGREKARMSKQPQPPILNKANLRQKAWLGRPTALTDGLFVLGNNTLKLLWSDSWKDKYL